MMCKLIGYDGTLYSYAVDPIILIISIIIMIIIIIIIIIIRRRRKGGRKSVWQNMNTIKLVYKHASFSVHAI